jgi:hypothetical protein
MYKVDDPIPERVERQRGPEPLEIGLAIPCARCGYILAGLKTSGRCPECAAPIRASVFADRLEYAAPAYVRRLWIGAMIGTVAVGVMLAFFVVTGIPLFVMISFMRSAPGWLMWLFYTTFFVLPGLAWAAGLGAWWLAATPDPALRGGPQDPKVRRQLRGVIVVEGACWVVLFGLGLGGVVGNVPPGVYIPIVTACGILGPIALLGHLLLVSRYVRELSPRLRELTVEEICMSHTAVAWTCAGVVVLCVIGIAAQSLAVVFVGFPLAFLGLCVLSGIHLGMLGIIRRSAREAMGAQSSRARATSR